MSNFNLADYATVLILRFSINGIPGVNKTDKSETQKLTSSNKTNKRHARVTKKLFAESARADAIQKIATKARAEVKRLTLPAEVDGKYMFPASSYVDIGKKIKQYQQEYSDAVKDFVDNYDDEITNDMRGKSGLADRSDYPDSFTVQNVAKFDYGFEPLPSANQFDNMFDSDTLVSDMQKQHNQHIKELFKSANEANTGRLVERMEQSIASLRHYTGAPRQRLHSESILKNLRQAAEDSLALNVAKDKELVDLANGVLRAADTILDHEALKDNSVRKGFTSTLVGLLGDDVEVEETTPNGTPVENSENSEKITQDVVDTEPMKCNTAPVGKIDLDSIRL